MNLAILRAEHELSPEGILVVGPDGELLSCNESFLHMWNVPATALVRVSDENVFSPLHDMMVDTGDVTERIRRIYAHARERSYDEIELKDGRIFERYSAPVVKPEALESQYLGRVWFFRDVTERARGEQQIREALAETQLRVAVERHAERLKVLWQIANTPDLAGLERIRAMLRQAAAAIRPAEQFFGLLGRVEGHEVIVLAVAVDPDDDDPRAAVIKVGDRRPLAGTIIPEVRGSHGWTDIATMPDPPRDVIRLGWRSVISAQFLAGGVIYSLTLGSRTPTPRPFGEEDFAYLDVVASSFANQLEVNALEDSLRGAEQRARLQAQRLEALLRIVNRSSLSESDLRLAMLREGAAAIRPGQRYYGVLARVHGSNFVVEAVSDIPPDPRDGGMTLRAGQTIPLEGSYLDRVIRREGATRSWDDIEGDGPSLPLHKGWRAFLITTFSAGGATWALEFISRDPAAEPLGSHEHAYVEILASYFANHLHGRWQYDQIQYQQAHDALTGLFNRSHFRSRARVATNNASHFAIILADVNAFHEINCTYGSASGDALLVEVGDAFRQRAHPDEIVGRIGGDVFAVCLVNPISPAFVRARAVDFAEAFASAFSTGQREGREFVAMTASIGFAIAPEDGPKFDAILARADAALSIAKLRGHGSIACYEAGMEEDAQRRAALRNELIAALAENQFVLYYQPHIEISTGVVTGCEALIRWRHPERGILLPGAFIPFAEETGIITAIDDWVMACALDAAPELCGLKEDFRLYFNLSGRQAGDPAVVRAFIKAARAGCDLGHIGVEITETDAMRDVPATRSVCRALNRLGICIAIDDFGTGYSSLSSLKQLPIDVVKIDGSFIAGIPANADDVAITDTIVEITKRFGFVSLAEGVERQEQMDWLRQRSCRYAQGYWICEPLPLDEFKVWLSTRSLSAMQALGSSPSPLLSHRH